MKSKLCSLLAVVLFFSLFLSHQPFSMAQTGSTEQPSAEVLASLSPLEQQFSWQIKAGDWIYADVGINTLWIVRGDDSGASQAFPIGSGINTGQKINWLGRTYDPITPAGEWMIKRKNKQTMCWVFCPNKTDPNGRNINDQTFLRLFPLDSETGVYSESSYGIHSTPRYDFIRESLSGFGSYGCILADYDFLKFLEQLYDHHLINGEEGVKVITSRAT